MIRETVFPWNPVRLRGGPATVTGRTAGSQSFGGRYVLRHVPCSGGRGHPRVAKEFA